jgi:hypothetical protein
MIKGRPSNNEITTVVVYKKSKTSKNYYLLIISEHVDEVLNSLKRKPLLPNNYEIVDIGVGKSFIEKYKKQYQIK